jgi:predicted amidophosphoribosyltransferase
LSKVSLPNRFTWIDETNRKGHYYLTEADRCVFLGEWFAGKGYEGGPTNQLIVNFKHKPAVVRARPALGKYKAQATSVIARGLRGAISRESIESTTWVPIPPSKVRGHENYDDRLIQALNQAFDGYKADVRPLIRQSESVDADHERGDDRQSPEELLNVLELDKDELAKAPMREGGIVLFDDVLTTGKHFVCCQQRIREVLEEIPVLGVFVARCIHQTFDFGDEEINLSGLLH